MAEKKQDKKLEKKLEELEQENNKLIEKIKTLEEVAARTQSQYVNLKNDFDMYMSRMERTSKEQKVKSLIQGVKSILPIIEELRKSVENIPDDLKEHNWTKGITIIYNNALKKLQSLNIYEIQGIGKEPDTNLHEPIGTQPADKKNKWKIIQEYEKWFVYKQDDEQIVIKPAKVIVWA